MKSGAKLYWNGIEGQTLAESDLGGTSYTRQYVYFAGRMIGYLDAANSRYYFLPDHLGSANVVINNTGVIKEDSDFYPFGRERIITDTLSNTRKFTGKERDAETGLDNFGARMYGSTIGRFISADAPFADQHVEDPQTWNLYSYTRNNPLKFVDPTGRELKLAVYLTTTDKTKVDQVTRGSERAAQTFRDAGVKNVTVEINTSADATKLSSDFSTFPAEKGSNTLVFVAGDEPKMTESGEFGRQQPLTNATAVNTDIYSADNVSDKDALVAIGNTMVHEGVHGSKSAVGQVLNNGHTNEPSNVLNPKAPVYDPNLKLNEKQKKELQDRYNKPGEEEKKK